ncbi:MAG: cysteine desulfurase family protein [Candidatus Paceibacterota bacterium]|jgi:cysteine desulfurase
MRKIYLDNAATTPVDKRVVKEMNKYWNKDFGNPSSIHCCGVKAKNILNESREKISSFIGAHSREIIFTSGGTEANNLAIFGLVKKLLNEGKKINEIHLITTNIEHGSILECFKNLEKQGCAVDYLKANEDGLVNLKDLRELIKPETVLVSIGHSNSEIGVVQLIKEIIKEIRYIKKEMGREKNSLPYFHIDASQSAQYLNLKVDELGVDMMTLDAQKMYGPKGVGALFVKDGVSLEPIILGGGQESGMRAGTENISLIAGFAKAFEISEKIKEKENKRLTKIRDYFFSESRKNIPGVMFNGHLENRLPNNINISIPGQDGEMLVLRLDEVGIICSSASACASGSGESYVVRNIYNDSERAKSTLRFSLGRSTKKKDVVFLLKNLKGLIN